jgi:hypothetical protein
MIRLSFFKTPKPKQFEFYNRFYDPVKDRQARVRQEVRIELGKEPAASAPSSIDFNKNRRHYRGDNYYQKASQRSSIRMAVVLAAAILVSYLLLDKLDVWSMIFQ